MLTFRPAGPHMSVLKICLIFQVQQVFRQVLLKTRSVEISDGMRKRRQSMPVVHGRGSMNLDPKDLAKIRAAAELSQKTRKTSDKNCVIS